MLAPEKPECRSKLELLVSVLASITNALRFLVSKLPTEQVVMFCAAVWKRMSASLPAISKQSSAEPLSPKEEDSKSAQVSAIGALQSTPAENGAQGKPAESPPSPSAPNHDVRESAPPEVPTLEPKKDANMAGEALSAPKEPCKETPVRVS